MLMRTSMRVLVITTVCIAVTGAGVAIVANRHPDNGASTARMALLQLHSASQRLAATQGRYDHRLCGQSLACYLQQDEAMRRQLASFDVVVRHLRDPDATSEQIAVRVENSVTDLQRLFTDLDAATSVTQYRSLTDALSGSMSGDYYELQDNTTYLGTLLNYRSHGRTVT